MKNNYNFNSFTEIELAEFHNPEIFKDNKIANNSARSFVESKLAHAEGMFEKAQRATPGSVFFEKGSERSQREIKRAQDWLANHFEI